MSVLAVIGTYWHRIDTIVCFSEGWKSGFVPCNFNKVQACTPPSFHFFFWAAWASGNDALRMRITAFFQSVCWRIIDFTRNQQGVLRVTRRLFGYCRKVAAARYVSSYSKHFGLLPKTLPPGCLSEVGQPVQTCGVLGLFLVLYTVLFHLTI